MAQKKKNFRNNPALAFISIVSDTNDITDTNDTVNSNDIIDTSDTINTNDIIDTSDTVNTKNTIDTTKNITIRFKTLNYGYLKMISKIADKSINQYINDLVELDQNQRQPEIDTFKKIFKGDL